MSEETTQTPAATGHGVRVFRGDAKIGVPLGLSNRKVTVRWPSDDEWIEYDRQTRLITEQLGDGSSRTITEGEEAASTGLLRKINLNGEPCEEDDAAAVTLMLSRCETGRPDRAGQVIEIPLTILGGIETRHFLRLPTEKELRNFNNSAWSVRNRRRTSEIKADLRLMSKFYDTLTDRAPEGYEDGSGVPVIHKQAVISELLLTINEIKRERDDEVFFE